jgi:hypothetical protein
VARPHHAPHDGANRCLAAELPSQNDNLVRNPEQPAPRTPAKTTAFTARARAPLTSPAPSQMPLGPHQFRRGGRRNRTPRSHPAPVFETGCRPFSGALQIPGRATAARQLRDEPDDRSKRRWRCTRKTYPRPSTQRSAYLPLGPALPRRPYARTRAQICDPGAGVLGHLLRRSGAVISVAERVHRAQPVRVTCQVSWNQHPSRSVVLA